MFGNLKYLAAIILIIAFVFGMTACGESGSANEEAVAAVEDSTASPEETVAEEVLPEVDTNSSVDELIGSWKDISDPALFVNVSKTDTTYQYEDVDGKYDATFENGKLKVQASDDPADFAEVYIDTETGHLFVLYQGSLAEFEKE